MASAPIISVKSLDKSFGAKQALNDVSLAVKPGEVFGFLGPNGAGKTTTIRCLMDYIRPSAGSVKIFGKDSRKDGPKIRQSIGYLSADNQLYPHWTGQQYINFMLSVHGKKDETGGLVSRLDLDLHTKVKNLSSGNKQKLSIVLALCNQPKLLIMDEPTRGLDPMLQIEMYKIIEEHKKAGGTVFLSSHNLPEVQRICDRVAVIKEGKLVKTAELEDLLQMQTHVIYAVTKKKISPKELKRHNAEIISQHGDEINLKVRGKLSEVLEVITECGLKDLDVSHASLEDIFMEFYQ